MIYNYFRSDHLDNLVGIIVDTFPDSLKTVSSTFYEMTVFMFLLHACKICDEYSAYML
jgi:hypothetical protein